MTEVPMTQTDAIVVLNIRISYFEFVSYFGFRASYFQRKYFLQSANLPSTADAAAVAGLAR
jgi:hypothetical protein